MYDEIKSDSDFRIRAEIDLNAIYHNVSEAKKHLEGYAAKTLPGSPAAGAVQTGGAEQTGGAADGRANGADSEKSVVPGLYAVIKADAYGHGAVRTALKIDDLVDGYCVALGEEALELREAGIKKDILILGFTPAACRENLINADIIQTVFDIETAELLSKIALSLKKTARVHIKIDSSMGRIGFLRNQAAVEDIVKICSMEGLDVCGIFTHFADADSADKSRVEEEYRAFSDFVRLLEDRGCSFKTIHCANSAAIIDTPYMSYDKMRYGISLYGLYPSDEVGKDEVKLIPAMSVRAKISYVKTVPAGTRISYGGTYETKRETVIATIPAGYADGISRSLSNRGCVLVKGKRAPITGRICMDQFMVDITGIPGVKAGEIVTLLGKDGNEEITADELANLEGTINYEVVCDYSKRIKRMYLE